MEPGDGTVSAQWLERFQDRQFVDSLQRKILLGDILQPEQCVETFDPLGQLNSVSSQPAIAQCWRRGWSGGGCLNGSWLGASLPQP